MNEFDYIERYIKPLDQEDLIGDDAAPIIDGNLAITKDILIEGVHFFTNTDPYLVAQKALRVNLSDLAAMGATPSFYLLGLALPKQIDENWWQRFSEGLKDDNKKFSVQLIGGDTTAHDGVIIISITAIGHRIDKFLLRSGAKPGDEIYISGTLGDAALGLLVHKGLIISSGDYLKNRYSLPEPRISLGEYLSSRASSCIDISDGLIQDANHICRLSRVGMEIYLDRLPLSPDARNIINCNDQYRDLLLSGGDDYELLFTAPNNLDNLDKFEHLVTKVGRVVKGAEVTIFDKNHQRIAVSKTGFQHFD